jgi:hypothetical protein
MQWVYMRGFQIPEAHVQSCLGRPRTTLLANQTIGTKVLKMVGKRIRKSLNPQPSSVSYRVDMNPIR